MGWRLKRRGADRAIRVLAAAGALAFIPALSPQEIQEGCGQSARYLTRSADPQDVAESNQSLSVDANHIPRVAVFERRHGDGYAEVVQCDSNVPAAERETYVIQSPDDLSETPRPDLVKARLEPEAKPGDAKPTAASVENPTGQSPANCLNMQTGLLSELNGDNAADSLHPELDPGRNPASIPPGTPAAPPAQLPATKPPLPEVGTDPEHVVRINDPATQILRENTLHQVGVTATGAAPNQPVSHLNLSRIQQAVMAADTARGDELLQAALTRRRAMREAAVRDTEVLDHPYRNLPMRRLAEYMDRARDNLDGTAKVLEQVGFSGAGALENVRFRNYTLNARDKASAAASLFGSEMQMSDLLKQNTLMSLFGTDPKSRSELARKLAELLGSTADGGSPTSQEALVNRTMQLAGLPDALRRRALAELKLLEKRKVTLQNGQVVELNIPHNGYFFGGGDSAVDCSSFVSSILPSDIRQGAFTTQDFRTMWIYARSGKFPAPPSYDKKRRALVEKTAKAFIPIDLAHGEGLAAGDLLVHRLPWKAAGHVFIVRDFNPRTLEAKVVEAAQSAGGIRERSFNLSSDPANYRDRRVRAGLLALRLKPVETEVCTYRESKGGARLPAAAEGPHIKARRSRDSAL